jgi:hypothetical protein
MVESDHQVTTVAIMFHRRTVDRDDIEFTVIIAVDETNAPAGGFNNVVLLRFGNVRDAKPSLPGNVFKSGRGRTLAETSDGKNQDTKWRNPHKAPRL